MCYKSYDVRARIDKQSPGSGGGVHAGKDDLSVGAEDHQVMFGHAAGETAAQHVEPAMAKIGYPLMPDFDWTDFGDGAIRDLLQLWHVEKSLEPEKVRSLYRDVSFANQQAKQLGIRNQALEIAARAIEQALD